MNLTTEHDAIQQDVSEDQQQQEAPKSRRELALEAIDAQRISEIEKETGVKLDATTEDPADDQDQDPGDTDAQLQAQMHEPSVIDKTDGVKVKIKVDGEEQEIELSKVLAQYQKNSAADKRLEEATRLLKEAEARASSPTPAPASQAEPPAPAAVADDELVGKAKEAFALLYSGDEDAAAKAIASMVASAKGAAPAATQPQYDVNEITNAVQQRLAVDSAFAKIQSDYPDILADKDLDALSVMKARAKEAEGMPRADAMLAAAQEVYKLIGREPAGRPKPEPARTTRDEKLARKATLDEPRAVSAPVASSSDFTDDENPSAVIAAMAARRLGQSLGRKGQ